MHDIVYDVRFVAAKQHLSKHFVQQGTQLFGVVRFVGAPTEVETVVKLGKVIAVAIAVTHYYFVDVTAVVGVGPHPRASHTMFFSAEATA